MPLPMMRSCDGCNACCTAVGVNELGKPCNFRCEHQTEGGCGIYGKHPESCRTYQCLWLEGILLFKDRPDVMGVVMHTHEEDGDFWLDCHLLPKAKNNIPHILAVIREILIQFSWFRGARLVAPDQIMNVDFPINLTKYPGGEPDGREGTLWVTTDGKIYTLDAPTRIKL